MSQRALWTDADDDVLRRLIPLRDLADIAQQLGRTPCSVAKRAARLGLERRKLAVPRDPQYRSEQARKRARLRAAAQHAIEILSSWPQQESAR